MTGCFTLFVAGQSPRSLAAKANLHRLCEEAFGSDYAIEVVDVLESPERAEKEKVPATPFVIKRSPGPVRRLAGDLSDRRRVLFELQLAPDVRAPEGEAR